MNTKKAKKEPKEKEEPKEEANPEEKKEKLKKECVWCGERVHRNTILNHLDNVGINFALHGGIDFCWDYAVRNDTTWLCKKPVPIFMCCKLRMYDNLDFREHARVCKKFHDFFNWDHQITYRLKKCADQEVEGGTLIKGCGSTFKTNHDLLNHRCKEKKPTTTAKVV